MNLADGSFDVTFISKTNVQSSSKVNESLYNAHPTKIIFFEILRRRIEKIKSARVRRGICK